MDATLQDIRHALRRLLRDYRFTAIAVVTLALGLGASTSIFSIVHAVLLAPPPFERPAELYAVDTLLHGPEHGSESLGWSYPYFDLLRRTTSSFAGIAAYGTTDGNLGGLEVAERVRIEMVSASYFPTLGVGAHLGRTFLAEEDVSGAPPVALLGHGLWSRRLGADPAAVGRTVWIDDRPLTIVGVLPEGFRGLSGEADVWVPLELAPSLTFATRLSRPFSFWLSAVGRLSPGVGLEQARAEMTEVGRRLDESFSPPEGLTGLELRLVPLTETLVDPGVRGTLWILLSAVAALLVIACANLANLLLTRGLGRRREMAVRTALGAGRRRLAALLLSECLLLALIGGTAGLLVAGWLTDALASLRPAGIGPQTVSLDSAVLGFNFAVALLAGLLFGLAPAWQAARTEIRSSLQETPQRGGRGLRRLSARPLLAALQIALALVLSIGAGLMVQSFYHLQERDLGFEPEGLLAAQVSLPRSRYDMEASARFFSQLLDRLRELPAVGAAATGQCLPLVGACDRTRLEIAGRPAPAAVELPEVRVNQVSAGFFETLGIDVLEGRGFTAGDGPGRPRVAVVNRAAARELWAGQSPLGEKVYAHVGWGEEDDWAEVVGVVGDLRYGGAREEATVPTLYVAAPQFSYESQVLVTRSSGEVGPLVAALRATLTGLDPNVPLHGAAPMTDHLAADRAEERFAAVLLGSFATLALLLAALGIYGVMAYSVSGRVQEIGIRLALGAERTSLLRLVLGDTARLTAAGVAAGVAAALAATRVLGSRLYGIGASDPATFAALVAMLAVVALAAGYLPARRAAHLDPVQALRTD